MALALAHELRPHNATAVSLTPGCCDRRRCSSSCVTESNWRDATKSAPLRISESPAFVGRAVAALAQDPDVSRWNGKSLSSGQLARSTASPISTAASRRLEVRHRSSDRGKPADVTGYR